MRKDGQKDAEHGIRVLPSCQSKSLSVKLRGLGVESCTWMLGLGVGVGGRDHGSPFHPPPDQFLPRSTYLSFSPLPFLLSTFTTLTPPPC